jgi:prepilin-type N-terminal cleavage/methylation domain-containing protein
MTRTRRGRSRRAAFTLIELLVVIAIIAILVALTAAAVMRALSKGPELATKSDIQNMDSQLSATKSNLGVTYLPSHLRLREDSNYTSANPAIQADYNQTKGFLQQAFGRHIVDPGTQIDWNGDGAIANTDLLLEGEQVLVFLLGGQPQYGANGAIGMKGYPPQTSPGGTTKRGPFYEFQPGRLRAFSAPDPLNGNQPSLLFPVYVDSWNSGTFAGSKGMPYVFFSSYVPEGNGSYQGDCPSLMPNGPYVDPTGRWLNASTWQIISAGADGQFGPGGLFNPATGVSSSGPGADDQANFSPHKLGVGAN